MKFVLRPILDKMEEIYQQPRTVERFQHYLSMLQGKSKKDMLVPIAGYNPMGSDQVLMKLRELKNINAEDIAQVELESINAQLDSKSNDEVEVVLNLADDLGGAWSNFYATDFASKFSLNALVERNFCAPYFWTGEDYTEALIQARVRDYVFRTLYWKKNGKLKSLKDHFEQEQFVQQNAKAIDTSNFDQLKFGKIKAFYQENQESDSYNLIFNFFYGDEACESLAYPTFGMSKNAGFEYAKYCALPR